MTVIIKSNHLGTCLFSLGCFRRFIHVGHTHKKRELFLIMNQPEGTAASSRTKIKQTVAWNKNTTANVIKTQPSVAGGRCGVDITKEKWLCPLPLWRLIQPPRDGKIRIVLTWFHMLPQKTSLKIRPVCYWNFLLLPCFKILLRWCFMP